MNIEQRAGSVREVAERVALWNEVRTDDFQDRVVRLVNEAREQFRDGVEGELPAAGADPLYDALIDVASEADSSPIGVRDACGRAFEAADEVMAPAR